MKILFGINLPVSLPEDWTLVESPVDWGFGISPEGQRHYLSETHAYPCRIATGEEGFLSPGQEYIDTQNGVVKLAKAGGGV
jgi:hypothetical protein